MRIALIIYIIVVGIITLMLLFMPKNANAQTSTPTSTPTPTITPTMTSTPLPTFTPTPDSVTEITSTFNITVSYGTPSIISVTKSLVTSNTYVYSGTITIPPQSTQFNPFFVIAMLLVFSLVGAGSSKPTMFIIIWGILLFSGVLQFGEWYIMYPLLIALAGVLVYKFIHNRTR